MKLYSRCYEAQIEGADPLVILHGLFGNQGNWAWHARELSSEYEVYAFDLRNHGRSPWSDTHDYPAMAEDVAETMESLGLSSAHILGHSMGGKVAMQLALTQPERVRSLVVVDIAPVTYPDGPYPPLAAMKGIDLAGLDTRQQADEQMQDVIEESAVRDFLLTNLQREEAGGFGWRCNLQALDRHFDTIRGAPPAEGQFTAPVLFIKGSTSDYVLADHREAIARRFPNTSLKVIDQAGHWVHSEKPRAFLKVLRGFLAEAAAARA